MSEFYAKKDNIKEELTQAGNNIARCPLDANGHIVAAKFIDNAIEKLDQLEETLLSIYRETRYKAIKETIIGFHKFSDYTIEDYEQALKEISELIE